MMTGEIFRIVIGDNWQHSLAEGSGVQDAAQKEHIDFSRARDVVDIVVDGASISGRIDEDSIFFLVRDLLFAMERLISDEGSARVSFYEGPWELVLQRVDDLVYVTMYRGGRRPEVIVKDHSVRFEQVVHGVIASAESLEQQALDLDPNAASDPVVSSMAAIKERVAVLFESSAGNQPSSRPPEPRTVESTRWLEPRTEKGFSFGFRFQATVTDLFMPGKPQGSDLNPLLFKGRLAVHARGRRLLLGEGYLYLQTERLIASLRQLLTAWEEGRPISARLVSDGVVVGVRLGRDDGLVITLMDSRNQDAIIVLHDLTPWEYADAVLGLAREVRRRIVEVNGKQRRNLRIEALSREVRALTTWTKDSQREDVINRDVERYKRLAEPRRVVPVPVEIYETSRLRFTERWRVEVEGLDLNNTRVAGPVAAISARGSVLGLDTQSGNVLWRRETDPSEARFQVTGTEGLVRAAPTGQIEMYDMLTGVLKWRTLLAPRSGGAPVLLVSEHGRSPGLVVVAEEERKLVALDMRTGESRWRFSTTRGGRFALRRFGRLLYIVSNDGNFNAVDTDDGNLVWRFSERTRFTTPPAVVGETLLAPGGRPGRAEGRLFSLNAFSGERHWEAPIGGGALTSPIIADNAALIPVRIGGRHELVALDTSSGEELWRKDCAEWAIQCALMPLEDRFVINSAGGVIRALHARTGEEQWTTVLGPTCSDDVPFNLRIVLRGGMLFVPADTVYVVRPDDGHVIHTLGGEPPVPDLLHVDPSLAVFIGEDSGHVGMYDLTSRLSVVS
jgi:outer membrane protein assembly factor BamB